MRGLGPVLGTSAFAANKKKGGDWRRNHHRQEGRWWRRRLPTLRQRIRPRKK